VSVYTSPWLDFGLKTWDPFVVIDSVLDQVLEVVSTCDGVAVELLGSQNYLIYVNCSGTLKPFTGLTVHINDSLSGKAILSGSTKISYDCLNDPDVDKKACEITGIRSMAVLPLRYNLQIIGVLKISSQIPNSIKEKDIELVELLAEFVALAIGSLSELSTLASKYLMSHKSSLSDNADSVASEIISGFVSQILAPHAKSKYEKRRDVESLFEDNKLNIVFQPIVDLTTNKLNSVEALSRFNTDPYRSPDLWYKDANEVHLGTELELYAVGKILGFLDQLPTEISLSINISPEGILTYRLKELLRSLPEDKAERLILEITEHVAVDNYVELNSTLNDYRKMGIKVAIDDTGSGISSLTHILELSPDIIKLDRSLISNIDNDPVRSSLSSALAVFAKKIDATVVAEGIETQDELETVKQLDIYLGQGFYLAKPMPISEILNSKLIS
jgi:EAL domain-containing protein (putative c-di-GMP-specific phosphodiesterase class I)/putative methionine-R-sulfoxide reductase with GAF domain